MSSKDKQIMRRQALAARAAQTDKDQVSREILAHALALPEFQTANKVLFYVDRRHEVRTTATIRRLLVSDRSIVVPYCIDDNLELCQLIDWTDLEPGCFGILEPKEALRDRHHPQRVPPQEIDLAFVPGVAFDRLGHRIGYGKGYYDRLLAEIAPREVPLIGLAFECQVFDHLPTQPHDIPMTRVVTESQVYGTPTK